VRIECENREESKEEENAKKGEENDTFISSIPSRVSAPKAGPWVQWGGGPCQCIEKVNHKSERVIKAAKEALKQW
jgi:hypothetical protein